MLGYFAEYSEFQTFARKMALTNLTHLNGRDETSLLRENVDEFFLGQADNSFADWCSGYTDMAADTVFTDRRARRQLEGDNGLP